MYSASVIAKWFLAWADVTEEGDSDITALKLQKLLYYAQGHYVAANGTGLFGDNIKAWAHGPVVPQVWHDYKDYGSETLKAPRDDEFSWDEINQADTDFLISIWNRYAGYSAWYLRNKTHREAPWIKAFDKSGSIDLGDLKQFFSSIAA